jgi:hypothetical protein
VASGNGSATSRRAREGRSDLDRPEPAERAPRSSPRRTPQGAANATSSSISPSGPAAAARPASSPNEAHAPDSAAQSAGVKLSSSNSADAAYRARDSRPARAARNAPSETMPANQSKSPVNGASPARLTTPVTRPASSAPHASACGPPPGVADHRETRNPERVGQLRYVGRRRGNLPTRLRARTAIAGAAIRQEPDAAAGGSRQQRLERSAGLRRAMQPHKRERVGPLRAAAVVHPQRAAIPQAKIAHQHHEHNLGGRPGHPRDPAWAPNAGGCG